MFVPDVMHEFELGVWKAIYTHLLSVLYAYGSEKVMYLNSRLAFLYSGINMLISYIIYLDFVAFQPSKRACETCQRLCARCTDWSAGRC